MKTNLVNRKKISYDFYPPLSLEANAQEIDRVGYLGMKSTHTKQYGYCTTIRKLEKMSVKPLKSFCRRRANKLSSKLGEEYEV